MTAADLDAIAHAALDYKRPRHDDGPADHGSHVEPDIFARWDDRTYTIDALADIPAPEWLVADVLPTDALAMIYGPSGQRKTFFAVDLACSVATGLAWHGRTVKAGAVLYVAAEGVRGIGQRFTAWQLHHRPEDQPRLEVLAEPVNLAAAGVGGLFAEWCHDREPALVVVDTLARCTVGAEENSAKDMGAIVEVLDRIRRATGACVAVVHHTGKDGSKGARGSTALRGAMDTELEVTSAGSTVTIRTTKSKDAAEPLPIQLEAIEAHGSLVLTEGAGMGTLTGGASEVLAALLSIEVPGGIASGAWQEAAEMPRTSFYRHRADLIRSGAVLNIGTDHQPRYIVAPEREEP